jgi:hypothetical protein
VESCISMHVPVVTDLVFVEYAANYDDDCSYERLVPATARRAPHSSAALQPQRRACISWHARRRARRCVVCSRTGGAWRSSSSTCPSSGPRAHRAARCRRRSRRATSTSHTLAL